MTLPFPFHLSCCPGSGQCDELWGSNRTGELSLIYKFPPTLISQMDDTSDIEYKKNQLLNTQSCVSLVKHDH